VVLQDRPVLIVDDNATNRRILEEMLLAWRMAPVSAASVPEALAAVRAAKESGQPFDIILADVQMPSTNGFTMAETIVSDPSIAGPRIVMLTSAGQPGDAARCRALGVAGYLTKPINRSELRDALVRALSVEPAETRPPLVTRHSLREARASGRILLVEDNSVNQLVASRVLEKGGYTVTLANNGREALALLEATSFNGFACVLMDVQMPEMDGFEATSRIRQGGPSSAAPIIALTASVSREDRDRCIEAGMNDHLGKPATPEQIEETLARWVRGPRRHDPGAARAAGADESL
jgi:CheY-like chemotaxis protein